MARPFMYPHSALPKNGTQEVHVVRPISARMYEELFKRGVRKAAMSKGTFARHSPRAKEKMRKLGVEVVFASARGKPLSVDMKNVLKIVEMRKDYVPYRRIAEELGISKSSVHYLMRYAKRDKLRDGKRVIGF